MNVKRFNVKPYPIPFFQRPAMEKELNRMLDWGVIERSSSPYASLIGPTTHLVQKISRLRNFTKSLGHCIQRTPKMNMETGAKSGIYGLAHGISEHFTNQGQ